MTNTYGPLDNQILSSLEDGVLEIILNRPEKHNALTYPMYEELTRLLTAAADNPATRVVLVTGTGDFFSSGNDVNSFVWGAELAYHEKPSFQFMNTLAGFQKPIIAAVNGNAIGIGFTMLLHFDLIYASDTSRFRMPFLSMGFIPEFASTLLLRDRLILSRYSSEMAASSDLRRLRIRASSTDAGHSSTISNERPMRPSSTRLFT
jgi:enoyl-CoA hydratase/carnithine racemase